MNKLVYAAFAACLPYVAFCQEQTVKQSHSTELNHFAAANTAQSHIAAEIAEESLTPEAGLEKLKKESRVLARGDQSGEVAMAFSVMDVGRRLAVMGKGKSANVFFVEAERALDVLIKTKSEKQPKVAAMYLRERGILRARHLGKYAEGRADLEAAIKLQPEDGLLKRSLYALPRDPSEAAPRASKN